MRSGIIAVIFLIVVGVIIANALVNYKGTKVVFDGLSGLWQTSVNGLLGQASKPS